MNKNDILNDLVSHNAAWIGALAAMEPEEGARQEYWMGIARTLQGAGHLASRGTLDGAVEALEVFPQLRTALSIMQATAEPAGVDHDDAGYWAHEMTALNRLEQAIRQELGAQVVLEDWRDSADIDGSEELAPPAQVKIMVMPAKIDLEFADGRSIWVEIQGPDLRIMAYNPSRDEPMIMKVPTSGDITADTDDYLSGPLIEADEEGPEV